MSPTHKTILVLILALILGLMFYAAEEMLFDTMTDPQFQRDAAENFGIRKK